MTPLQISILLHYWTTIGDIENLNAPAVREAIDQFLVHGILEEAPDEPGQMYRRYRSNEDAMRVYIDAICAVPLPSQVWAMPTLETAQRSRNRQDDNIPF